MEEHICIHVPLNHDSRRMGIDSKCLLILGVFLAKGSYLYMLIEECFHDYKIDRCLYVLHVKYDDIYIDCI